MRASCWAATPWSRSDRATPPELVARAQQLGLLVAQSVVFPSMARAPEAQGGATRLVAVKAVSPSYPLRGRLQLQDAPAAPVQTVAAAPASTKAKTSRSFDP